MGITTKTLRELLDMVSGNQLLLPEIQREFVWKKKSIKLLFDSLFNDIPIGSMLVWKAAVQIEPKPFLGKKKATGQVIESFYGYLLDGQQRLTAVARVLEADDDYPLLFYLWPEDD